MRVLIVDDDPCTRMILSDYLEAEHFEVLAANNGVEALDLAESQPAVDRILVDYHMPGMDGLDCIRALRAQRGLSHSRVFLMSAEWNAQQDARREGVRFVRKPLDLSLLVSALRGTSQARAEAC